MAKEAVTDKKCNSDVKAKTKDSKENQISEKDEAHDIEAVYTIIGFGRIQLIVVLVSGLYLLMVINETLGISIITLASQCDFQTNSVDKAILSSASYMGIVFALYFWGYLSDIVGRRTILIYTTLTGNLLSFIAIFLPTFWPFVIFRFLVGVFISGASSTVYAYLGEFFTAYYRPIVINFASMFIGFAKIYFPAISWAILTMDWSIDITDEFRFRPWRLITIFYLLPGFIASIILMFLPESPRYYLSVNKIDEAYAAVDWFCRHSRGETLADLKVYEIKSESNVHTENLLLTAKSSNVIAKMWRETRPLLKRPHFINLLISSIVMISLFMISAGMGLWYPTIQNRVGLIENSTNFNTVCEILENDSSQKLNATMAECDDSITQKSFIHSITLGVSYIIGYCVLGLIINPVRRKGLLIGSLGLSGFFCLVLLWIKEPIVIVVSFVIFLVLPGLAISVLSGAVVDLMPTYLRGKAVCLVLMLRRTGIVIGANIIGALLETHCVLTFGFFGGFGILCAAFVFLLPI